MMKKFYLLSGDDDILQIVDEAGQLRSTVNVPVGDDTYGRWRGSLKTVSKDNFDDPDRDDFHVACEIGSKLMQYGAMADEGVTCLVEDILVPRIKSPVMSAGDLHGLDTHWSGFWHAVGEHMRTDILLAVSQAFDGCELRCRLGGLWFLGLKRILRRACDADTQAQEFIKILCNYWFNEFPVSLVELPDELLDDLYPDLSEELAYGCRCVSDYIVSNDDAGVNALKFALSFKTYQLLLFLAPFEELVDHLCDDELKQFRIPYLHNPLNSTECNLLEALVLKLPSSHSSDYQGPYGEPRYEPEIIDEVNQMWLRLVERVLKRGFCDVHANSERALYEVLMADNLDAVRLLIQYGADVDAVLSNVSYCFWYDEATSRNEAVAWALTQ